MDKNEIIKRANSFRGANREFSQEMGPIVEGLVGLVEESEEELSKKQDAPAEVGTVGQVLQLNAQGEPEWVTPTAGTTPDSEMSDDSTNAIQNKVVKAYVDDGLGSAVEDLEDELETKANKDGYYAGLVSGAAENLVGHGSVPASFLFRTSGGDQDLGTGTALISELKGNGMVWNQIAPNGVTRAEANGITRTKVSNSTTNYYGTCTVTTGYTGTDTYTAIQGHKYLKMAIGCPSNCYIAGSSTPGTDAIIVTAASSGNDSLGIGIPSGVSIDKDVTFMCIDLTVLFNGSVPENFTVADFKEMFPLDYYAYNGGEVLPFAAQNLVTTGFNQYNPATGKALILGGQSDGYQITGQYTSLSFTGISGSTSTITPDSNGKFNVTEDGELSVTGGDATSTCVHLVWSGYRNGEYEPYEKHTLEVDPASWKDTDGNLIFPHGGMFGRGSAFDFAKVDADGYIRKGTRVFVGVDMGTPSWSKNATYGNFQATFNDGRYNGVVLMPRYVNNDVTLASLGEGQFTTKVGGGTNLVLGVKDSTYADAAAFKTAMSGVMLYYELATPVEKELATPVPASYYVNDFGTEEWTPANGAEPYSAPCQMDVQYAMNAVDTLRNLPKNYISKESFDNFCDELASKLGTALNKTITITPSWDDEDMEYDYSISITDIESEGE